MFAQANKITEPTVDHQEMIRKNILSAHVNATVNKWCDSRKHNIGIKQGFNTACWTYHNGEHRIFVGDQAMDMVTDPCHHERLVESLVYHEMAHALFTERNLAELQTVLSNKRVPFSMFNLFEDVRIEHKWRESRCAFDWGEIMKMGAVETPIALLYGLMHLEGALPDHSLVKEEEERVLFFYRQTCHCASSYDVIDLCDRWIEMFGKEMPPESHGDPNQEGQSGTNDEFSGADLRHALQVSQTGEMGELEDGAQFVVGSTDDQVGVESQFDGAPVNQDSENQQKNSLLLKWSEPVDHKKAAVYAQLIKRCFELPALSMATHLPSKRINKRSLLGIEGVPDYSRKSRKGLSCKKVNLFVDCSGSMEGVPIENARLIIAMFNNLAASGIIECNVILSSSHAKHFNPMKLPVSPKQVGCFARCDGLEHLENCFRANLNLMKSSDVNFVITDGYITDGDVDKGFYSSRGIFTIGLYCNQSSEGNDLKRWFNLGITRPTIEELVTQMVLKIKS